MEIKYRIKKETLKCVSTECDEPQIVERYYPMVSFGFIRWYYLYTDELTFTYTENKQEGLYKDSYEDALDVIAQYNSYWKYKDNKDKTEPSEYNGTKYFYNEENLNVDINQTVNSCIVTKGYTFPIKGEVSQETKETLAKAYQKVVEEELQDCREED